MNKFEFTDTREKNTPERRVELLAPAGNLESLKAGVNSGADAVYFGFGSLNARRNAQNFEESDLAEAAKFCKARGVSMHLTLNTLVYDREVEEILQILELACKYGIDAVIVQDLAVARLIREVAPGLPVHASTQMTVHNVSGAQALKNLGFSRVVLAREMSRDEIAAVISQVDIETEVFVHGALCMSVSGQCTMSSVIGERSGNRGLCAQPCRLPFSTGKDDNGFALSLRDLTLASRVDELVSLGITSFKIEGRMKRPEYVTAAVTAFREALEGNQPQLDVLEAAFSRNGFTQGYFDGRTGLDMFGIRQKEDVLAGQKVFKSLAAQGATEYPRIGIDYHFSLAAGKPVCLTVSDGEGAPIILEDAPPEVAINRPTTEELVRRGLEKTGGTFFVLRSLTCEIEDGLIYPVSAVNQLRRKALEMLAAQREATLQTTHVFQKPTSKFTSAPQPKGGNLAPLLRAQVRELGQATPKLISACELISAPLDDLIRRKDTLPDTWLHKLAVSLPRLSFGDDKKALTEKLQELHNLGVQHLTTGNIGGILLGKELGFTVHGEPGLNISNSLATEEYAQLGLTDCIISVELSLLRARAITAPFPIGFFAYGKLPLMLTRNCPVKLKGCGDCKGVGTLTDRRRETFEVRCTKRNYSEVFNGTPLYLADRWQEFYGLDFGLLYFTGETRTEVDEAVEDYTSRFSKREGITHGLYYRNAK